MTKSELAEAAWRRAAAFLGSDLDARQFEIPKAEEEARVLDHIRTVVIPHLRRTAERIRRNRKATAPGEGGRQGEPNGGGP